MSGRIFLPFIILLFIFSSLYSQNSYNNYGKDWDDWDNDVFEWYGDSRPMIELNYGFGNLEHKAYKDRFGDIGMIELKLGYNELDSFRGNDNIIEIDSRYMFGSKFGDALQSRNTPTSWQYVSEFYRFGFGNRKGFGYHLDPVSLIPYTQTAVHLTKINKLERNVPLAPGFFEVNNPDLVAERYGTAFRVGTLSEAGVKLEVANMLALNVSYEGSVLYPRLMVWKWLGSEIIEQAGYNALGEFVEEIMDRVPAAGPVMNVLLKAGYQYAFFQLRKDKMTWPFSSEKPLTMEQVKFGVTLTF